MNKDFVENTEESKGNTEKEEMLNKEELNEQKARENEGHPDEIKGTEHGDHEKAVPREEFDELYDKYIRLYSEFENYRRRSQKEMFEIRTNGRVDVMQDMVSILDDFERAINSLKDADKGVLQGIEIIYNKLKKTLEEKGLEEMKAVGQDFDPDFHEAMTKIPAPSKDLRGKVVDEIEKGYMVGNKVVRFAKVVVGE